MEKYAEKEHFMREAIFEARKAAETGDVPVGAVVVREGRIIARGRNRVEKDGRSSAHAEMAAIAEAERVLGSKWLAGCTMYVTLEPCSMCAGATVLARLDKLVIGTDDPKNGACGSVMDVVRNEKLNHRAEVETGVLSEECAGLLRTFFRELRIKKQ
jgi:tRNA(adenine34) deaminase